VATENDYTVTGVELNLNTEKQYTTTVDGGYFFSGLTLGEDYTIAPRKDEGYLNGVSTYDLVLIIKHILALTPLDSPYKLIAADANNSGRISTLDLILLRKNILAISKDFGPNNNSWRFVPAGYIFPQTNNPWAEAFPEVLNINDFNGTTNGDFVAIKVGDVNNSAFGDVQPRSKEVMVLQVDDRSLKAGQEYRIPIAGDLNNVDGYQFALRANGIEWLGIGEGIAKAEHFGLRYAEEGVVLTSWTKDESQRNEGDPLFELVIRATADISLSEALSIDHQYLTPEAYNTSGEAMNVVLSFAEGINIEAGSFELKQNTPNPFREETVIGFNLAEASEATLTINDVTGRVLKVVKGVFAKGANQISIDSKELPARGVFYYTLTAGEHFATKKMILLE
jgi:hypothetical protein